MLAKPYRFHGYASLKFVYSKGKQVRLQQLSLKYHPNQRRADSRCAVVVSKKVAKKAPTRNRIRRRVYEVLRRRWSLIASPHDIIITVFDEKIADMPAKELDRLIDTLLTRAHLYK